jgi:hypothetical protein
MQMPLKKSDSAKGLAGATIPMQSPGLRRIGILLSLWFVMSPDVNWLIGFVNYRHCVIFKLDKISNWFIV